MVDIVAVTPAYVDEAVVDNSRVGVFTSRWELALRSDFGYRVFTHRRALFSNVDAATGIAHTTFAGNEDILGILVERGGSLPSFAVGVVMKMDGVFLSLDPTAKMNRIYNTVSLREYEVKEIERKDDPINGGLAYYVNHVGLVELDNLGGL